MLLMNSTTLFWQPQFCMYSHEEVLNSTSDYSTWSCCKLDTYADWLKVVMLTA